LQKEPKLKRARQIPEWDSYDREIAAFAARISGNEGALAASVDDLAGTKKESSDIIEGASGERDAEEEMHVEQSVDHHGRIEGEL
jgi:UDP-glucose:glycoprotein glucosyltransferase